MSNLRIAASVFLLLSATFALFLTLSTSTLPPLVATHFNSYGRPDAWMRSSSYMAFFTAAGIGLPVIIVAAFFMVRWLPAGLVNIPRRDFWLTSERAPETHRYLLVRGLWLGCMMLLFMLAVHYAVVRANQLAPPHLAPQNIFVPMGIFIMALVIWIATFLRHFAGTPSNG